LGLRADHARPWEDDLTGLDRLVDDRVLGPASRSRRWSVHHLDLVSLLVWDPVAHRRTRAYFAITNEWFARFGRSLGLVVQSTGRRGGVRERVTERLDDPFVGASSRTMLSP